MYSLQSEIEEMMQMNPDLKLVELAVKLEKEWIDTIFNPCNFMWMQESNDNYRVVRQCGDKQVGQNTSLTSVYVGEHLIGTFEIKFDIKNNKLKVDATC